MTLMKKQLKHYSNELKYRADFKDAYRFGDTEMTSEEVARKRFELGEISEDEMNVTNQ